VATANWRVQPWRRSNTNTKSNRYTYTDANANTFCDAKRDSERYADSDAYTYARTSSSDAEAASDAASETVAGSTFLLQGELLASPVAGLRQGFEKDGQKLG
jgi:hypothetical protein